MEEIQMMPTDEQPEGDGNVTFSGLEECDQLVQAFRDFLISEVSKPNPTPLHSIVAEFSRRVTFISLHVGMQLNDDQAYSLLSRLNDPLMAQLAFDSINSKAGHQRLLDYLAKHPFPHYEADPVHSDRIVRIEEDGTRTSGRFVNRQFVVIENE